MEDLIDTGYSSFDLCHSILEFHSVHRPMIVDLVFNFFHFRLTKSWRNVAE